MLLFLALDLNIILKQAHNNNEVTKMDDDIKLLNEIYKNTHSLKCSLNKIIPKTKDESLKSILKKQAMFHNKIYDFCVENLTNNSEKEKNIKVFNNAVNNIGLDISLMINSKPKNVADILIRENNVAIHDITRSIVEFQGATNDTKELANNLLNNERNNIEELQKFI